MEYIIVRMHQDKVQPDPSTCCYVFTAYIDHGFNNTAMEALQVLSMWMISVEDCKLEEKRKNLRMILYFLKTRKMSQGYSKFLRILMSI